MKKRNHVKKPKLVYWEEEHGMGWPLYRIVDCKGLSQRKVHKRIIKAAGKLKRKYKLKWIDSETLGDGSGAYIKTSLEAQPSYPNYRTTHPPIPVMTYRIHIDVLERGIPFFQELMEKLDAIEEER